jgi:hypothetical protein
MKAIIAAAGLMGAATGGASATTYDFTGGNMPAGGYTLDCAAGGVANSGECYVTSNNAGLGVNGVIDINPGEIDSFPLGSYETLIVNFLWDVILDSFTLGNFNTFWDFGDDDYEYSIDNGLTFLSGNGVNPNYVGLQVSSLMIRASSSSFWTDGLGNDEFTLARIQVSSVPLPAGGLLLAGAIGGLGMMRRRKAKKAA